MNIDTSILKKIANNMETVMIGKREIVELTLTTLICRGHLLIEDVPGVGKTSLASALAKSLACSFKRIQFTPDIMPSDITGFSIFNPKTGSFDFRKGLIMSQVVLADEINRTSPKTQSSLLEAMEEKQVTVDGQTYPLDKPFIVLATQNPIEYLGTYPLPEAQMDRFFMKVSLGYPTKDEEVRMIDRFKKGSPLLNLSPVADAADVMHLQKQVEEIYTDRKISEYMVALVRHTRENSMTVLGASPRATINLHKASQARAIFAGRDYVTPDDCIFAAPFVLSHRVILKQEAKLNHMTPKHIILEAIEKTAVPLL